MFQPNYRRNRQDDDVSGRSSKILVARSSHVLRLRHKPVFDEDSSERHLTVRTPLWKTTQSQIHSQIWMSSIRNDSQETAQKTGRERTGGNIRRSLALGLSTEKMKTLVYQLKNKVIPIFKVLHPESDALFLFDISMNHHAKASDALVAGYLNLSGGGINTPKLRSGWFVNSAGEKVVQEMQNEQGQQKGLRTILQERRLWQINLNKDDALRVLSEQNDFQEQQEWLQEVVTSEPGFIVDYFLKFHCEFNFIEIFWAACKLYTRENCKYSWKSLQETVPKSLQSVTCYSNEPIAKLTAIRFHCSPSVSLLEKASDTWTHIGRKSVRSCHRNKLSGLSESTDAIVLFRN